MAEERIGYLIFGGIATALTFLLANYARIETVAGAIAPDKRIPSILPARGRITATAAKPSKTRRE